LHVGHCLRFRSAGGLESQESDDLDLPAATAVPQLKEVDHPWHCQPYFEEERLHKFGSVLPAKQEEWYGDDMLEHEALAGYNHFRPALEEVTYNGHSWLQGSTVLPFDHLAYQLEHVKRGKNKTNTPHSFIPVYGLRC
jgi:hypothetical protein